MFHSDTSAKGLATGCPWVLTRTMTFEIAFDPATKRHPLRRGLPASVALYAVTDHDRWRRDVRDFLLTFATVFVSVLTLFG